MFIANMINMLISILTNFVLPKYLSIDTYSYIKTYQLYVGMIGVLHLGYVDGMFLKYGGKEMSDIDMADLNVNVSSFRLFQLILSSVLTVAATIVLKDYVYIAIALVILPLNMAVYFKSLYQAIGEFKKYSRLMNATSIITFFANFALLFVCKTDNYKAYLSAYVIINAFIWIVLEFNFERSCKYHFKTFLFSFMEVIKNIKDGILLMLGNFANSLLTSMDRWFVKGLLSTIDFAQYSFACSMETMVNVAVTPISVTLYNYFCKKPDKEKIVLLRNSLIVVAAILISCAFPAKFILEIYLTKYIESTKVLFCLFGAQLFYIVIKSVYVNLYKAMHLQRKYFFKLVSVIMAGFVLNIICYQIVHSKEAFAIGTLISALIWFILADLDFKEYRVGSKQKIYIFVCLTIFLLCGYYLEATIGFIIYILVLLLTTILLMKRELKYLMRYALSILKH